jgi:membrane protein
VATFASVDARIDWFQRRHAWLGFPLAVRQKYSDDRGGYVAAAVTYYAFFSIFPILIVAVTILGLVASGDVELQRRLAASFLGQIPVVGSDLRVHAVTGSPTVLVLGIVASLLAGMKVFVAAEMASELLWVDRLRSVRGYLRARLRALELLLVVGGGALVTTVLGAAEPLLARANAPLLGAGLLPLSLAADVLLFWTAFRLLAPKDVHARGLLPGAAVAGVAWAALQKLGAVYVSTVVTTASATYGTFAAVIGLLSYSYLSVTIAVIATDVNVVKARQLWPRRVSLFGGQPAAAGDERAAALRSSSLTIESVDSSGGGYSVGRDDS